MSTAQLPLPTAVEAEVIQWLYRPQDTEAHAFGEGRGWLRAKCRQIPLTIALVDAPASMDRCGACVELVNPPIVEPVTETELRALHGDR
jgi:hypothetical protein